MMPLARHAKWIAVVVLGGALGGAADAQPDIKRTWPCRPDSFIQSDPWPRAGEVRRNKGAMLCKGFEMTRAFVDAPGGFSRGELFVAWDMALRSDKLDVATRRHLFVGAKDGLTYSYAFERSGSGGVRIRGDIVRTAISTPGIELYLQPGLRAADSESRFVECNRDAGRCDATIWRLSPQVLIEFFSVSFDAKHPRGNVCVFIPLSRWDAPPAKINVRADGRLVVDGAIANSRRVYHCLEERSGEMLKTFLGAKELAFEIVRSAMDEALAEDRSRLDPRGVGVAVDLARFLYEHGVVGRDRVDTEAKFRAKADALLDGGRSQD